MPQIDFCQLLASHDDELRELARRLHDDVGQLLTAVHTRLQLSANGAHPTADLRESLSILQQAISRVRDLSSDLGSCAFGEVPFPDALRYFLEDLFHRYGLSGRFIASASWGALPLEIEATCFRAVREAVLCVIQHDLATRIRVELRRDAEFVELAIRNDGPDAAPMAMGASAAQQLRSVLAVVCLRVEVLAGTWEVLPATEDGTIVRIALPIESRGLVSYGAYGSDHPS